MIRINLAFINEFDKLVDLARRAHRCMCCGEELTKRSVSGRWPVRCGDHTCYLFYHQMYAATVRRPPGYKGVKRGPTRTISRAIVAEQKRANTRARRNAHYRGQRAAEAGAERPSPG